MRLKQAASEPEEEKQMVNVKPASFLAEDSENLSAICAVLECGKPCEWVWCCVMGMSAVFVSAGRNQRLHIYLEDWKTLG